METTALTLEDEALIDHVVATNERTVDPDFFDCAHVAAGGRTRGGAVYDGVSPSASAGRSSVCAEPVAVGSAIADGYRHDEIETCVAVAYPMPDHDATEVRAIPRVAPVWNCWRTTTR